LSVSECRIGETCAARDLCIRPSSCGPGDVEGECAPGCTSGLMCTSVFVCVPGTTPADAGRRDTGVPASDGGDDPSRYRTSYCSCAVPSAPTSPRWLALGAAALGCAIAIRRRR
jgi:MYXO-CTERM domain-containing protein